jgi:hypothetical protein
VPIVLQNSQNADRLIFREKTKQATIADQCASNPLPESPVSLTHGGVVPHIIIRSSRLRLGEFESHAAKDFCNTICQKQSRISRSLELRDEPLEAAAVTESCR